MASTVLPNGIIIPEKYSRDWYNDLYHNWQELDNLLGGGTPKDGTLTIQKNGTTVGTFSANQATDETINITVPTVNDATLTIQKNGTTVDSFTANSSTDKTVNITVPTKTSDLTNDSNFVPSTDLATVATSGNYNDLSNKPTIPTVNNGTLTIQKNGTDVTTFSANASTNATANITVPTKTSDLTNDSGFITEDNTKIPLAGSNQISGSLIPERDNTYNLGSYSKRFANVYAAPRAGIHSHRRNDDFTIFSGGFAENDASTIWLYSELYSVTSLQGAFQIKAKLGSTTKILQGKPDGTLTWSNKNVAMQENTVPRSGGAVMTGEALGSNTNNGALRLDGGTGYDNGASIGCSGKNRSGAEGYITLHPSDGNQYKNMYIQPSGTWTWDGTAVQLVSDQRLKQQITEIDDKLLDAWEDVDLVQFKYNDAVDQKKGKARLHTGYVVQQIDSACKSHGVDVSQYGLYCHEEYPQETEEVEVEQEDGTKTKERKVIREASEHYSLRYTEVYAVECMYLRRCIARLTARIEELEKGNNTK